jgi:hypothetical protein
VSVARCEERALHTLRPGIDPFESALASFYISSNPLLYPLPIALGVLRARKSLSLYSEVPGGLPRTFDSMNSVTPNLIAFDSRWRSPYYATGIRGRGRIENFSPRRAREP